MTEDQFWDLIETSRQTATEEEEQVAALTALVAQLPPKEIIAFDTWFTKKRDQAYRWNIWAVAYIINGGCSDDGFDYFRGWLIGQGRKSFEAALSKPATIGDLTDEEVYGEQFLYIGQDAYKTATGEDMPARPRHAPSEPAGKRWDETELENLYPDLCAKFW